MNRSFEPERFVYRFVRIELQVHGEVSVSFPHWVLPIATVGVKNVQIIQRAVWAPIVGDREREWKEWRERSWEREGARRGRGRQLPPTPTKPSTLQVKQQPPFTRISHSPSHVTIDILAEDAMFCAIILTTFSFYSCR